MGEIPMRSKSLITFIALTALFILPARQAFAGIYCQSLWSSEMANLRNYMDSCTSTGESYAACKQEFPAVNIAETAAQDYADCMKMPANANHPPTLPSSVQPTVTCHWAYINGEWALLGCDVSEIDPRQVLPLRKPRGHAVDCAIPETLLHRRRVPVAQII
jgi:hypothetical protein